MEKQLLTPDETFAHLKGTLDSNHPFLQLDEDTQADVLGQSCNRDGTAAYHRACTEALNMPNSPLSTHAKKRKKMVAQWLSERDKTVYLHFVQSLVQSQRPQDEVKRIFGTLHDRAAVLGSLRCTISLHLANTLWKKFLTDQEHAVLVHLVKSDLLSSTREEQLHNIFERTSIPMQDVTYIVAATGLKLLERYKEVFKHEMTQNDFEDIQKKLIAFLSKAASFGRKNTILDMTNFLLYPEAIQYKRNIEKKLSFSITPHREDEILPYIHPDNPYFHESPYQENSGACPALQAHFEENETKHTVLSATTADFIGVFRHAVFDERAKAVNIPKMLCDYE